MRTTLMPSARLCPRCRKPGIFYASQSLTASWCVACFRAVAAQRYAAHKASLNATVRAKRLAAVLAIPEAQRTRRQRLFLLRRTCGPDQRICGYCWESLHAWSQFRWLVGGRLDGYCRTCRRTLDRVRHRRDARCRTP